MSSAWQNTRNTYEAAALAALDIEVRPVTMRDLKSGVEFTDWNLATASTVNPERHGRAYVTGALRQQYQNGHATGDLAGTPLHPYLVGLRAMHNRARLLDAQKGAPMHSVCIAPGSYVLQHGSGGHAPLAPFILTVDADMAVALIGSGCVLVEITHNGREFVYKLARYALPDAVNPQAPRVDGGRLMQDARENALWPARRWEVFAHTLHTLHCLRHLRARQTERKWITIPHRTYRVRGAAITENASSDMQSRVQRELGIRL